MKKINYGTIVIDAIVIIIAAITSNWLLLLLLILTGGYTYNTNKEDD